ncbi:hypothetical protein [Pseudarthrobacter sp. AB1]|uniref:hypothetical protein n=1 Tax=Pseudarthrobacter sp. AB1 TaxID=2138309 RepID=UPI00186B6AAF|nr:hypothetical protein [Pseudarthrobacter sp. AB1]MBE4716757.1 hypothetical protein [Pseudarthrobacter sp. AB1]
MTAQPPTPADVWFGMHSPTIVTVPRADGATDLVLNFDGGYGNPDDAAESAILWAQELNQAGLKTYVHADIIKTVRGMK